MVIIFGNEGCAQCKIVKKYCEDNEIEHKYINIDENVDSNKKLAYDKVSIVTEACIMGSGLPLIKHNEDAAGFTNFKEKFREWHLIS